MGISSFAYIPLIAITFSVFYYFYLKLRGYRRKGLILERKYLSSLLDGSYDTDIAQRDTNDEIDIEAVTFSPQDFEIGPFLNQVFAPNIWVIDRQGKCMTEKKFDQLWIQISNAAQDIINKCDGEVVFNEKKKQYISFEYDRLRKRCKEMHMLFDTSSTDDISKKPPRIDRHKVAACIAGAILNAKPFESNAEIDNNEHKRIVYLANETLALFSALAIVTSFIRDDKDNTMKLDTELKNIFLKNGFIFPTPLHSDYLPWLLFLLRDNLGNEFNVLAFSNILYLIETYTFSQLSIQKQTANHDET